VFVSNHNRNDSFTEMSLMNFSQYLSKLAGVEGDITKLEDK